MRRLSDVRYVLFETKGDLTIVDADMPDDRDLELVRYGLRSAAGWRAAGEDRR